MNILTKRPSARLLNLSVRTRHKQMTTDPNEHYFNDDGTPFNPDFIRKPSLCVCCAKDDIEAERVLCDLTRADQQDSEEEFQCFAYRPKGSAPEDRDDEVIPF